MSLSFCRRNGEVSVSFCKGNGGEYWWEWWARQLQNLHLKYWNGATNIANPKRADVNGVDRAQSAHAPFGPLLRSCVDAAFREIVEDRGPASIPSTVWVDVAVTMMRCGESGQITLLGHDASDRYHETIFDGDWCDRQAASLPR